MSDIIERADAALDLWDATIGVIIEITYGMTAAGDAYRNAPEMVRELVSELKDTRTQRDEFHAQLDSVLAKRKTRDG